MTSPTSDVDGPFPVVGIGASAGGLKPLLAFFKALPGNTGCAYIVVQHLSPDHESHLEAILGREAPIPVVEVKDDLVLEPDHAYVIASNQALIVDDGRLRIQPAGPRPRHPVDTLFKTLGQERGSLAVGIVLSGTGSNGTAGARVLKAAGGALFVQTPTTAEYDGMPRSAISTGIADRIMEPKDMPAEVVAFLRGQQAHQGHLEPDGAADEEELGGVLSIIRARSGQDFRSYKTATLSRRIHRRMGLKHLRDIGEYAGLLRNDPRELDALRSDLLINVSAFFRDEESWNVLQRLVIEPLVERMEFGSEIRAWIPGCATGEEAYSLAMLLLEAIEQSQRAHTIKVFATDPADGALSRARLGVFPGAVAESMPPERLARFFDEEGDTYVAKPHLRESITFAPQNLLSDPPFSHLDIVCCRNLLIYLKPQAQDHVLSLLHFALREDGTLFLGNSESTGEQAELFDPIAKEHRIYRRTGATKLRRFELPGLSRPGAAPMPQVGPRPPPIERPTASGPWKTLAEQFAPPSALVDRNLRVLHLHGDTDPFLALPQGAITNDLLQLARPRLSVRLRTAAERAFAEDTNVSFNAPMDSGSHVQVTLRPIRSRKDEIDRLLVSFELPEKDAAESKTGEPVEVVTNEELEKALRLSREELGRTVEELERSNQELQAANEEASSINEEFQAANEELETSREELQSLNEELNTVNIQLQNKVEELERRTNDLSNLLSSSDVATLFLDEQMKIRWFTPAMRELLSLEPSDMGRPVTDFARRFTDEAFIEDVRDVLKDLQPRDAEVVTDEGRWFLRRALPYRTDRNRIAGVVANFVDITARCEAEEDLRRSEAKFRALVHASASIVWAANVEGQMVGESPTWRALTGQTTEEWLGTGWLDAVHPEDREQAQADWWDAVTQKTPLDTNFRLWCAERDDWCHMAVRAVPLLDNRGTVTQWVGMNTDITDERRAERRQQVLLDELQHRVKNLFASIAAIIELSKGTTDDVDVYARGLRDRLDSLCRTQDLLSQRGDGDVDLRSLIEAEIDVHRGDDRFTLEGPRLMIPERKAQALGMAVHELVTNAAKYGALSVEGGHITVSWARLGETSPRLVFSWVEKGVQIEAPHEGSGFGSELLTEAVPYMIRGTVDLRFEPTGVRCIVEAPLKEK
jgi:two-component system CheB/CheR fusion protein